MPLLEPWTWWHPLLGGMLIGTAAGLYLLLHGRVAGISGMTANALGLGGSGLRRLSMAFLAGLMLGAPLAIWLLREPQLQITAPWPALVLGGQLVGYGTRLGSGCTSGHGICGLARLSPRSIVATLVFMACAMFTVFVTRHVLGWAA